MKTWLSVDEAKSLLQRGSGRGIRIAILDSGVETSHPALANAHLQLADDWVIYDDGLQLKVEPGHGSDVYGHGTAIAGILKQIAPEADIGSFRVLGTNLRSRTAVIREGVRQALDRGYQILNCSFGCTREDHVLPYKDWIDEAYLRGRHIVAACNNVDFTQREWPGHFPTVITVNFTRAKDPETLLYRRGNLVEFLAKGQDIEVAWRDGRWKKVTGSSFAAPHVAGLLARLLSGHPDLPPLQAKALLHQLAEDYDESPT